MTQEAVAINKTVQRICEIQQIGNQIRLAHTDGLRQAQIVKVSAAVCKTADEYYALSTDLAANLAETNIPVGSTPEEAIFGALGKLTSRHPERASLLYQEWFSSYHAGASTISIHDSERFHTVGSVCAAETLLQSELLQPAEIRSMAIAQKMLLEKMEFWTLGSSAFGVDALRRSFAHFPIHPNDAPMRESQLAISCQSPTNQFAPIITHGYNDCPR